MPNGYRHAPVVLTLLATACASPDRPRLNAPPQGEARARSEWADYYAYHNDQGMLADMSIADLHFVPHSAQLSGVGQARLERYAELLATSGGTLNYDTQLADQRLLQARLREAQSFLASAIPGAKTVRVVTGLPGGRGLPSAEASAGQAVARQPEPRNTAYRLNQYMRASGAR